MKRAFPATTPIGNPPPITFPYVARSARMPNIACAPPGWARNPVIISSKTSATPLAAVERRSSRRNSTRSYLGIPALHRLDEHRGQLGRVLGDVAQRLRVAVVEDDQVLRRMGRDPGRDRQRSALAVAAARPRASTSSKRPW